MNNFSHIFLKKSKFSLFHQGKTTLQKSIIIMLPVFILTNKENPGIFLLSCLLNITILKFKFKIFQNWLYETESLLLSLPLRDFN